MQYRYVLAILAIIAFIIVGLVVKTEIGKNMTRTQQVSSTKVRVVASFYPMYYFASQIGGDKATVKNLTPAGSEPHDYEPTTQDIATIEKSNLLILNGGKLEAWGNKIKDILKGTEVKIIVAADSVANQQIEEEGHTIQDPHVWLNPQLAKVEVKNIEQGFEQVDPQDKSIFQTNAKALSDKLDILNTAYKQGLSNCAKKNIVTSHAAFGYLAKAYGLNQVAIAGLSPDAEPSSQQLVDITKFTKQNNIRYIFFESLVSPKLSQTIASEVGATTIVLDPIEGLSDDDIKAGRDYFTIMQSNLANLRTALQCQ